MTQKTDKTPPMAENGADDAPAPTVKCLIVRIADQHYAFHAEHIREVVMDAPLYYVPFTPPYIRGFINRHGRPHTVFDLNALLKNEKLTSGAFLIAGRAFDQTAFMISDVTEILNVTEAEIQPITAMDENDNYYSAALTFQDEHVFILNVQNILMKLSHDLETG